MNLLMNNFEYSLLNRVHIAREELRQQQALSPTIDHPAIREAIIRLASNGLRTFCWLEKQARRYGRSPQQDR
jgi:hypothetical protein